MKLRLRTERLLTSSEANENKVEKALMGTWVDGMPKPAELIGSDEKKFKMSI